MEYRWSDEQEVGTHPVVKIATHNKSAWHRGKSGWRKTGNPLRKNLRSRLLSVYSHRLLLTRMFSPSSHPPFARSAEGHSDTTGPSEPLRFLIVDDNADGRFLISKTLLRKFPTSII